MNKHVAFFIIASLVLLGLTYITRRRRRINNLLLLCTTVFLGLSIVETAYRNFFKDRKSYFQKTGKTWSFGPHPVLGVQIDTTGVLSDTELTSSGSAIYHARYTIIADSIGPYRFIHRLGFLNPSASGRESAPAPGIVFLGCSFTFGQGVNDSETLPSKVGALTDVSTLNLGGIGYGIHHVYKIFLDKYATVNNTGRLFIYTMIPDHVLRASGLYGWSPGPSFRLAGDSLVYVGSLPVDRYRFAWYASLFGTFSFIKDMIINIQNKRRAKRVAPDEYEKAYWMIRKMDQYSRMTGGHFIVLSWDNISEKDDPNRYYRQILADKLQRLGKEGVDIISVSDILDTKDPKYYIPIDGHPNAMAYDRIGRYLVHRLFRNLR
ncbi:MAG TPA: hypothetical protein VNV35_09690 [Puia sp.]|jgi:hypothetical protein|nr:hypothetical protein [Puia sp.]